MTEVSVEAHGTNFQHDTPGVSIPWLPLCSVAATLL